MFFDRESISHGPASLKIVVVLLVGTLLNVTLNITVTFKMSQSLLTSQHNFYFLKSLKRPQKSPKVSKRPQKSQKVPNV